MARSDLLLTLVKSSLNGDQSAVERTVEALIAEERAKKHHGVANRLADALSTKNPNPVHDITRTNKSLNQKGRSFLFEYEPHTELSKLILPKHIRTDVEGFLEEQQRADVLRAHGLEPRNRVLLAGPPGNGKTTLAESIAYELGVPLLLIRYDQLIGSLLGESATQLREVFEYARTQRCVVFFDEFDAVGKERGDRHESGEIRRLVNTLLMQIDRLPSYTIVVAATNHPELLDRAIWRRFQLRAKLPAPGVKQIKQLLDRYLLKRPGIHHQTLTALAKKLSGASLAEIEDFARNVLRLHVLALEMKPIKECISEAFELWQHRYTFETNESTLDADAGTSAPDLTDPDASQEVKGQA